MQKQKVFLTTAIIVIILIMLGVGGYFIFQKYLPLKIEKPVISNSELAGFWQNCPSVAAGYCNRYHFYSNGDFEWYANQMACFNGVLAQKGTWKINNGKILLTLSQQFSGQAPCGPDALPAKIAPPVISKSANLSISDIFPADTTISYYKYILIDNQKFYQLSNDPTFNNSEDQQVWNQNNQTANWKTYTNTQYGFSIKYPPGFSMGESDRPDEVALFTNNDKSINISQIQFGLALGASGPIPFEQYVQDAQSETVTDFSKGGVVRFLNTSSGSITYEVIGAPTHIPYVETVFKYVNGNTNEAITLDINGQNAIDIKKLENKDYSDFADLEKINSEMVSTFKLTNTVATCIPEGGSYGAPETSADLCCAGLVEQPTTQSGTVGICVKSTGQTAGWKTYTDSQYGFAFQYPQSLSAQGFATLNEPAIKINANGSPAINNDGCLAQNNGYPPNPVKEDGKIVLNNNQFCLSETGDAAMGHNYTTYFYTIYKSDNYITIILDFGEQKCDNLLGGPNYQSCLDFANNFNLPKTANDIISTFKFTK